ncbi:hypothetical protein [Actinomadura luteofluorescens]|uniref:hypothetical protein n=1 Tax=Actinomadura luteofluorescens TaxID=46163 RepID=UPI003D94E34B
MAEHTTTLADTYADAVLAILAPEFPALDESSLGALGRLVRDDIAAQATMPDRRFEVIVTYTREWRLVPEMVGDDRWRVQIACRRDAPTPDDSARERRINEALRAINVHAESRRSRG